MNFTGTVPLIAILSNSEAALYEILSQQNQRTGWEHTMLTIPIFELPNGFRGNKRSSSTHRSTNRPLIATPISMADPVYVASRIIESTARTKVLNTIYLAVQVSEWDKLLLVSVLKNYFKGNPVQEGWLKALFVERKGEYV